VGEISSRGDSTGNHAGRGSDYPSDEALAVGARADPRRRAPANTGAMIFVRIAGPPNSQWRVLGSQYGTERFRKGVETVS